MLSYATRAQTENEPDKNVKPAPNHAAIHPVPDPSLQAANVFALNILRKDLPLKDPKMAGLPDLEEDEKEKPHKNHKLDLEYKDIDLENKQDVQLLVDLINKQNKKKSELLCMTRFFQDIPFFSKATQKLPPHAFISLVKRVTHEFFPARTTVFRKNDRGEKYYIVLEGKVAVLGDKIASNLDSPKSRKEYDGFFPRGTMEDLTRASSPEKKKTLRSQQTINFGSTSSPTEGRALHRTRSPKRMNLSPRSPSFDVISKEGSSPGSQTKKFDFSEAVTPENSSPISQKIGEAGSRASPIPTNQIQLFKKSTTIVLRKADSFSESPDLVQGDRSPYSKFQSPELIPLEEHPLELDEYDLNCDQMDFKEYLDTNFPTEVLLKELGPGNGFGELALITNYKRSATVVTMEDTHFAVLDKPTYEQILNTKLSPGEFHEELYREKINFLKSIKLFEDWSDIKISALLMMFEIKTYTRNNVIYSADEPPTHVYILKSGEIELVDMITIEQKSPTKQKPQSSNQKDLDFLNIQKIKPKKTQLRKIIAKIGPGSIFGEEEVFERTKRKYTTVITSHKAELYSISRKKFFESLRGSWAFLRLLEQYQTKKAWRANFVNQINNSIIAVEENKIKVEKIIKTQDHLATQVKVINPRLVLASPTSFNQFKNKKIDPNDYDEIIEDTVDQSRTKDYDSKEYMIQNSPLSKQREESPTVNAQNSNQSNMGASIENFKKTIAHLTTSRSAKNIAISSYDSQARSKSRTPKRMVTTHLDRSDVVQISPRISSKPVLPFYDLETEPIPHMPDSRRSNDSKSSESRMKKTSTNEDRLKQQKLFGEVNALRARKYLIYSNVRPVKSNDMMKTSVTPEKMRNTIYSRIAGLNEVLASSPKFTPKVLEQRRPSRSFAFDQSRSQERTTEYSVSEYDRSRPRTSTVGAALFPVRAGTPKTRLHPRNSGDEPPKEVVNIHVQKRYENPKPQFHGGFLLMKVKHIVKQQRPDGLVAVGGKLPM